jgi:hypothetical protein
MVAEVEALVAEAMVAEVEALVAEVTGEALAEAVAILVVAGAISLVGVAILVAAGAISLVGAAILVAGAISPGLRVIVLPAIASRKTTETTLRGREIIFGTEITSGTGEISFLEIPSITITRTTGMITPTTGMMIRTTAVMTTILATITTDNPHQPK